VGRSRRARLVEVSDQAVIREVEEETNLLVQEPQLVNVVSNIILDESRQVKHHFIMIYYLMKVIGGELRAAQDAEELRWVTFEEVENYDLTKAFKDFFKRSRPYLEQLESFET